MSYLKIDDLKIFMGAHQKLKDSREGSVNVFDENYKYIQKSVHKGLWYFGEENYCLFDNGAYVCKMSPVEIDKLIMVFELKK